MLLRWLDTGSCPLTRGGTSILDGTRLIVGRRRGRGPSGVDGLAFRCGVVEGDDLLSWAIGAVKEAFDVDFGFLGDKS